MSFHKQIGNSGKKMQDQRARESLGMCVADLFLSANCLECAHKLALYMALPVLKTLFFHPLMTNTQCWWLPQIALCPFTIEGYIMWLEQNQENLRHMTTMSSHMMFPNTRLHYYFLVNTNQLASFLLIWFVFSNTHLCIYD